ncbi:MAG TPA: tetratricopeptide repeat protein [Candidatus Limnocylindrales bacterium]|nr:tetratricopeptide repeat protein [Candidatus Limnocylindrales bacterium]
MKNRLAILGIVLSMALITSCSSVGRWGSHYDFETGMALFNQGRFADAIPYLEDATRENPRDAEAYLYLGRAYISESKWRKAIPPLRTAFRLSPRDTQQEIINLIIDAGFAAAINDFRLGDILDSPRRSKETL